MVYSLLLLLSSPLRFYLSYLLLGCLFFELKCSVVITLQHLLRFSIDVFACMPTAGRDKKLYINSCGE
jgi:hypothetical protein